MLASLGKQYNTLIMEISKLHDTAQSQGTKNWNNALITSNWKIGEQIVKVEQGNNNRASYGDQILKQLSKDLNRRYRKGFKIFLMNLAHSVQNY